MNCSGLRAHKPAFHRGKPAGDAVYLGQKVVHKPGFHLSKPGEDTTRPNSQIWPRAVLTNSPVATFPIKGYVNYRCGIGIAAVPSLPKAVRRVRLPYPALYTTPRNRLGVFSLSIKPSHCDGWAWASSLENAS